MNKLTEDQMNRIIARSREARAFLQSGLCKELEQWVETEKQMIGTAIVLDRRAEHQKNLARDAFVEQQSGYYIGIQQILGVIRGFANQEAQLKQVDYGRDTSTGEE